VIPNDNSNNNSSNENSNVAELTESTTNILKQRNDTDENDLETVEGKRLLSRADGKGLQIRGRYSKNENGIFVHFLFDNWSQLILNSWKIKIRANYLGIAPKHQLSVGTLLPGGIVSYTLPIVLAEGQLDFTRDEVEIAIKNELGIFPFKDKISPRLLFNENKGIESEQFLKLWKDLGESNQLTKTISTSHTPDTLRDRLISGGLKLIASRTKPTGKVLYYFIQYREFEILIEVLHKMSTKSLDLTLRAEETQGHLPVINKYINEVITIN